MKILKKSWGGGYLFDSHCTRVSWK